MTTHRAWRRFLDLIYPRACRVCRRPLYGEVNPSFCDDCWDRFPSLDGPCCPSCGIPFRSGSALSHSPTHRCGACRVKPPRYDRAAAAGAYEGVLREAIQLFKYRGQTALAESLARKMARVATRFSRVDVLVPVPLDTFRLRERQFNQSLLLCDALARRNGLPVVPAALERIRPTAPQTGLSPVARRRNVRGAFRVRRPDRINGRNILLIDDVFTTGATVNECARVLKREGAESVTVLSAARALSFPLTAEESVQ